MVLPSVASQEVPSREKVALLTAPTPATGIDTATPAGVSSGMATGGPE